jgi:hypothetical protein
MFKLEKERVNKNKISLKIAFKELKRKNIEI